jgi:hypothetical protein
MSHVKVLTLATAMAFGLSATAFAAPANKSQSKAYAEYFKPPQSSAPFVCPPAWVHKPLPSGNQVGNGEPFGVAPEGTVDCPKS